MLYNGCNSVYTELFIFTFTSTFNFKSTQRRINRQTEKQNVGIKCCISPGMHDIPADSVTQTLTQMKLVMIVATDISST